MEKEMEIWAVETDVCDGNQHLVKVCTCDYQYSKLFTLAARSRERKKENARIASGYHEYSTHVVLWDPSKGDFMMSEYTYEGQATRQDAQLVISTQSPA